MSLTVLLVNCHDVTGWIFDRWISLQTGMKSPLKWHNQPEKKNKELLESLEQCVHFHEGNGCFPRHNYNSKTWGNAAPILSSYEQLLIPHMQQCFRLLRATRAARYPNLCLQVAVTNVQGIYLSSIILAFAKNYARLELRSLFHSLFATLRLRGRLARDGFSSALWHCFGGRIFNMAANLSPKTVPQCTFTTISTRSLAQPQRGESDRAHFELLLHETLAKLNVGAIAFESTSLLAFV